MFEEALDLHARKITRMELHVESQSFALGRHDQGAEGIDLPLLVAHRTDWGPSLRGPGALEIGDEQKATFVQENQMGSALGGLFLYGATRSASNARSWPRPVAGRGAGVSDNSIPSHAAGARSREDDSVHEIPARLPWQCALKSITRFDTLRPVRLEVRRWPGTLSPSGTNRKADRDSCACVTLLAHAVCRYAPIARQNFLMRRACGRLPKESCCLSRREWRGGAVSLIAQRLLEASCVQA